MTAAVSSVPGSPSSAISVPGSPFRMAMGDASSCLVEASAVGLPTPTPSPSSSTPSLAAAAAASMVGPSPSNSPTPTPDFSVVLAPCSSDHLENGTLDSRGDLERNNENKRKRNPNWKVHEVVALIEAKRLEKERQQSGGYREQMKMADERWAEVEQYLIGHDVERDAEQARRKWENLVSDYKTIREWNRRSGPCQTYWDLSPGEKRDHKLPVSMDEVVFQQMDDVHGGGGGGGGGVSLGAADKALSLVTVGSGSGALLAGGLGALVASGSTRVSTPVDMAVPVVTAVTVAAVPSVAGAAGSIATGVRCLENGGSTMSAGCLAGVTVDRVGSGGGAVGGALIEPNSDCRVLAASVSSMSAQGVGLTIREAGVPGSPGGSILEDAAAIAKKKRKKFQGIIGGGGEHHYHHHVPGSTHEMAQMMLQISTNLKETCRKMEERRDVTVIQSERSGDGMGGGGGLMAGSGVRGGHLHGMGQMEEVGAATAASAGVIGVLAHLASALNKLAEQEPSSVISVLDQLAAAVNKLVEKV